MECIVKESVAIKEMMPIYTGLLTALVAIAVAFASGWWNHLNLKASIKNAASLEEKKRKLEKIEKIYENFNFWKGNYDKMTFHIMSFQNQHISYEEMRIIKNEPNNVNFGEALKTVEMLTGLYTSNECIEHFKSVLSARDKVSEFIFEKKQNTETFQSFQNHLAYFENVSKEFKEKLKKDINDFN